MNEIKAPYVKQFHARWADCDFNGHMRHSAFNDYGAHIRVSMFEDFGLPIERLMASRLGPVLFREETKFYKELRLNEAFTIDCVVKKMRPNGKVWMMQHRIHNDQQVLSAEIIVEGAWMDLDKRKVATPSKEFMDVINTFPRAEDFEWLSDKRNA